MRAIQRYLPDPRHTEVIRIFVQAKPAVAWRAARHIDLSNIAWVRFLFDLRTFPDHFKKESSKENVDRRLGIDQITSHDTGFGILYEEKRKEIVIGAIGKFWNLQIPFLKVDPDNFSEFNKPGWGKVAWSITVEPFLKGSTICLELRTTATDEESWKKLSKYYHLIGPFSHLIRRTLMEKLKQRLGVMELPEENKQRLPGDEIICGTRYAETDIVNIEAPREIVWRYLMQLGCDRAGWYSIDLVDHGGVPSTDHLVTEWTDRKVGDRLSATPKQDSFFEVWQVKKEEYFVIGGSTRKMNEVFKMSWAFVLEPIGSDATRLVVRAKMIMSERWKEWFMGNVLYPPVHGLMELVQLRTIKKYAERDALKRKQNNETPLLQMIGKDNEPAARVV